MIAHNIEDENIYAYNPFSGIKLRQPVNQSEKE